MEATIMPLTHEDVRTIVILNYIRHYLEENTSTATKMLWNSLAGEDFDYTIKLTHRNFNSLADIPAKMLYIRLHGSEDYYHIDEFTSTFANLFGTTGINPTPTEEGTEE